MKSRYIGWVMLLAVATNALGYYMPRQGRWLSRDPVGERGGLNHYSMTGNSPLNNIDLVGLELVTDVRTLAFNEILLRYPAVGPLGAFTGDVTTGGRSQPHVITPTIHIIGPEQPGRCCAWAERAQQVDVYVTTLLPDPKLDNIVGTFFTANGIIEAGQHEARRRLVYEKAYNKYIKPNTADGENVTKCGTICRSFPGDARSALLDYLNRIQQRGIAAFNNWVQQELLNVGGETWNPTGLYDHFINPYTVPEPPDMPGIPCPPLL
jgi:hypothetical protein